MAGSGLTDIGGERMRIIRLKRGDTLIAEGIRLEIRSTSTFGVPEGCKVFREERVTWVVRVPTEVDTKRETADTL